MYKVINTSQSPIELALFHNRAPVTIRPGLDNAVEINDPPKSVLFELKKLSRIGITIRQVKETPKAEPPVSVPTETSPKAEPPKETPKVEPPKEDVKDVPVEMTPEEKRAKRDELLAGRELSDLTDKEVKDIFVALGLHCETRLTRMSAEKAIKGV